MAVGVSPAAKAAGDSPAAKAPGAIAADIINARVTANILLIVFIVVPPKFPSKLFVLLNTFSDDYLFCC